jgi:tetratricopeptide (TPR) repeat protein
MDRTQRARWIAIFFPLGALPIAGCDQACSETARVCSSDSPDDSAPQRFIAPHCVLPLETDDATSRCQHSNSVNLASETTTDVGAEADPAPIDSGPALVPAEDTRWDIERREPDQGGSVHTATTDDSPSYADQMPLPWAEDNTDTPELQAVVEQADLLVRRGFDLAQRGAIYSARAQFTRALELIAEALDSTSGSDFHRQALAAGLTAIKESEDFQPRSIEQPLDVAAILQAHRTPILKHDQPQSLSSSAASQRYLSYAQEQLAVSVGGRIPGSIALYGLGRATLTGAAAKTPSPFVNARAITYYQAALLVNESNHLAANELGVLLAKVGRWEQAQAMLERSLTGTSQAESLHNLAVVYRKLGKPDLAAKAEAQSLAISGNRDVRAPGVRWLDASTFAQTAPPGDVAASPGPIATTAPTPEKAPASKKSAWRWPFSTGSARR